MPTKTTTEPHSGFSVYVGAGGSLSKTALDIKKALRANKVYVNQAKSFTDDFAEARDAILSSNVAIIVIGSNPMALVEGGACLGVGVGCLWVAEEGVGPTALCAAPMTTQQALSTIAEMVSGFEAKLDAEAIRQ